MKKKMKNKKTSTAVCLLFCLLFKGDNARASDANAPLVSDTVSEKKLEAFKFSMLKTSLEHEPSNIIARAWVNKTGDDSGSQETAAKTLKTLTYVRKYEL